MKAVYLRWATMLALSLMIAACGSSSGPVTEKTSAVSISISQQSQAQKGVVKSPAALAALYTLRITVSAPDYYHVYPDVPLTGTGVVKFTILVPNGLQRTFFVELLDANGLPVYYGSTTANLDGSAISLAVEVSNPFYAVTYDGNGHGGGSVPVDPMRYMPAQTVTVLDNTGALVKSGYSFSGWNTQANGTGTTYTLEQTFIMGAENITLYAVWTANSTYTVTYIGNGNTVGSVPVDATNYQPGQTFTVLGNTDNLGRSGYAFTGWNTQANGSGTTYTPAQTFSMGTENITLYAMWTASPTGSVTYDGNGHTSGAVPVDSISYQPGQTVTVLGNTGNLVKSGYSFKGWNTQANGEGTIYSPAQTFSMSAGNIILYAMWSANPSYSVVYSGNGHTGGAVPTDANSYQQGQTVTVLGNTGNLLRSGYSFAGWNTQANGTGTTYTPEQTFTMGAANITLYAVWTTNPAYSVTYFGNGHDSGTVPVDPNHYQPGQMVTVLDNTGKLQSSWFSFAGWNTRADGSGIAYKPGQTFSMGAANVTMYAVWVLTGEPTYTVTYDGNGNDGGSVPVDSNNYTLGQTVGVLDNYGGLVKSGYYLSEWNTRADGSGTFYYVGDDSFIMGPENVTLYAIWGGAY